MVLVVSPCSEGHRAAGQAAAKVGGFDVAATARS